ncbi:MAG: 2-C-methyl-D-erythritol 4-phosphate cytidylyltransferase, partial [Gammaproteobacteria bacterium]|nr:2-C-methyl-D-erythritol 4-phosphate cytidylyltransferase [Gammaproteobacteria bacterium]
GTETPKQYLDIGGRPVLWHTLGRLARHPSVMQIVVAIAAEDARFEALRPTLPEACVTVTGGAERCHSVLNALGFLTAGAASADDWVLVHDAVRPCLRHEDLTLLIESLLAGWTGGLLATPVRDTMKRADDDGCVIDTVDRARLWHALTPQMFNLERLRAALADALEAGELVTDEAQAMERGGAHPRLVEGHADNIKITHPGDLALAELYLAARQEASP